MPILNPNKFGVGESANPEDNQFFPEDDRAVHPDLAQKTEAMLGAEAETRTAMKLIMMDKDPSMVRERRQFMASGSSGVLALHLRHLQDFNKNFFLRKYNFDEFIKMFIIVDTNFVIKESKTFQVRKDHGEAAQLAQAKNKTGVFKKNANNTAAAAAAGTAADINVPNAEALQAEKEKKAEAKRLQRQEVEKQKLLKNINKYGGNIKTIDSGDARVGIDSLKHFSVECTQKSFEPEHWVNFYLFVQSNDAQTNTVESFKIAEWRMHIFKFMELFQRESYTIPMYDQIIEDQFGAPDMKEQHAHASLVCNLIVDFGFGYGSLGYGHGHQLEAHHHKVMKNLSNKYDKADKKYMEKGQKCLLRKSIFPRIDPASCRKDRDNILKPRHVGYPDFLHFDNGKSEIGSKYIRELTNKTSDASRTINDDIVNLKKQTPDSAKLFRARASAMRLNDGDDDGEEEDYMRMYEVQASTESKFVKDSLYKHRNVLRGNTRLYDLQKGRFAKVQLLEKNMGMNLEHQLSKKGELKTRKDMTQGGQQGMMIADRENVTAYGTSYLPTDGKGGLSNIVSAIKSKKDGAGLGGDSKKAPAFLGQ